MEQKILRELQLTQVEMLDEIVRICEKYNLKYFLIGGTLLGAARHKGFIPWDDDLDIVMPRDDYNKFVKICKTDLNKEYYLHSIDTDEKYWVSFIKLRKHNTIFEPKQDSTIDSIYKGVYVDIFPLDNAKKNRGIFQDVQAYAVKGLTSAQYRRRGATMITKTPFVVKILMFLIKPFSYKTISNLITKIMSINKNNDSEYFVNLGSFINFRKQTMKKSIYFPERKMEFEGKKYSVPNEWDYVLKRLYGNYMELPPIEKRVTHNPVRIELNNNN